MLNYGFLSTSTSIFLPKRPDWYSKNAPVIQLLLIGLGVKEKGQGREGGGGLKREGG